MPKPRLLIVDDSVVIRRALTAAITRESGVAVAGSASDGRIALMKIPLLHPDVVALDVDMPDMNGLETLTAIRQIYPRLPVIMLNVPTSRGAAMTVDALTLGASDYVTKPAAAVPSDDELRILGDELISKIAVCFPNVLRERRHDSTRAARRIDVLAIGLSSGGPQALMDLIPTLPADFPVPILIVQHMPPVFTKLLAERLNANARIAVAEGSMYQALAPGHAWVAPGEFHMAVERDGDAVRIVTHQKAAENSCRPAVDVLFRAVAQVYGPHALAVVMTGMGQDGLRGCEQIRAAGGQVLVQDEESSVVWGMPGNVARAGMADQILPLSELGAEILDRAWRDRRHPLVAAV
jgi:two-component system chemotaxis response regulator CheB